MDGVGLFDEGKEERYDERAIWQRGPAVLEAWAGDKEVSTSMMRMVRGTMTDKVLLVKRVEDRVDRACGLRQAGATTQSASTGATRAANERRHEREDSARASRLRTPWRAVRARGRRRSCDVERDRATWSGAGTAVRPMMHNPMRWTS